MPREDELEYAREQIQEAERRLTAIRDRTAKEVEEYVIDNNGYERDLGIESMEISGDLDDEFEENLVVGMGISLSDVDTKTYHTIDDELVSTHIQNIIIDCQLCIEMATKSMFKLVGKDHPFSHGISFSDGKTQGFYSEIPEDFSRNDDIIRVIFLTNFWSEFYELAKYGAPNLNVRPEMIFTGDDGSRAISDAAYCVDVAKSLLQYFEENSNRE